MVPEKTVAIDMVEKFKRKLGEFGYWGMKVIPIKTGVLFTISYSYVTSSKTVRPYLRD